MAQNGYTVGGTGTATLSTNPTNTDNGTGNTNSGSSGRTGSPTFPKADLSKINPRSKIPNSLW